MKQQVCLITGATGYIGSHLANLMLTLKWKVYIIYRQDSDTHYINDILQYLNKIKYDGNINVLINLFNEINPDVVFHLAASHIKKNNQAYINSLIQSNIILGTEILEAMSHSKSRVFINTGTYWQNYNSDIYNPVDLYAASKEAFEKIIQYYTEAFDFRVITLRLFDVYGEDDDRPKLLNLLKKITKTGESIDISPGEQHLDLVHINDVCNAYLKAYELIKKQKHKSNNIYGVSSGKTIQLKELITLFKSICKENVNINIGNLPYKKREVMFPYRKYNKLPNWNPKIKLEEILDKFINTSM